MWCWWEDGKRSANKLVSKYLLESRYSKAISRGGVISCNIYFSFAYDAKKWQHYCFTVQPCCVFPRVTSVLVLFIRPSTCAHLTADLPAQTGLCRQERACGHQNCTPCKPIRAACATFNMSKIKTRKLDRTVKYARVATFNAVSSVFVVFLHEAIEKCEQAFVLRHDRYQQDHQMN